MFYNSKHIFTCYEYKRYLQNEVYTYIHYYSNYHFLNLNIQKLA